MQNNLPDQSQNDSWISIGQITSINIDQFQASSSQNTDNRLKIGDMMNSFGDKRFVNWLKSSKIVNSN